MAFLEEFKKFAVKGNVIDLAVGVVIGSAFGAITTSLVKDVLMPPLGMVVSKVDFSRLKVILREAIVENGEVVSPAVSIDYGLFIQAIFNFMVIAFAIFLLVRTINRLREKEAVKPAPPTNKEEQLLAEIRDILKSQANNDSSDKGKIA